MTKEQKFYKALQDVFIGAKIEGSGGFVNLMRIKSSYYRKIEELLLLKQDVERVVEKYPTFRDELFDKLYSFFSRYFTESGSIYFNSTPFHNNIYEKVYTDEKDVILFWKTQMLYYVKTDRIFRSLEVESDGLKFFFDVSKLEHKKANEKRSLVYELKNTPSAHSPLQKGWQAKPDGVFADAPLRKGNVREDGTIVFAVSYSEKGTKTKQEEILKAIKRKGIAVTEEQLERAFRVFEKQSEVDFFINKNAKAFLQEQFKLWSYQYFWEGAKEWSADRVNQLQILKDIAFKIIDFISQFEDELVKIWNKPKFVKNSNYVITLDRIFENSKVKSQNSKLLEKIFRHKGIKDQIKEWQELGIVNEKFKVENVFENSPLSKGWHSEGMEENTPSASQTPLLIKGEFRYLPIDTKYFKDLELKILSLFEDLDKSLDGWLIKSENYQALNTILPKFKEKVQTIYIDPPFNLDSSDQFLYRTNYKDANWATLLENRLRIAREWLNNKGNIFVRCDYNGNWIVRCLMDEIFSIFLNEIQVNRIVKTGFGANRFPTATDSLFYYAKSDSFLFKGFRKRLQKPKEPWWHDMTSMTAGKVGGKPRIIFGVEMYPHTKGRAWTFGQEKINQLEKEGKIRIRCSNCGYLHYKGIWKGCPECNENKPRVEYLVETDGREPIDTDWTDIPGYSFGWNFQTENSEQLLYRVIESTSNEGDLVMDFFLGSGTTTAVAHKLGRKWIGVEMGEHFYSVVLPRMKKVLAYDKSGISKELKTPRQASPDTPLQEGNYYQGGFSSITNLSNTRKRWQIANMKMGICLIPL